MYVQDSSVHCTLYCTYMNVLYCTKSHRGTDKVKNCDCLVESFERLFFDKREQITESLQIAKSYFCNSGTSTRSRLLHLGTCTVYSCLVNTLYTDTGTYEV